MRCASGAPSDSLGGLSGFEHAAALVHHRTGSLLVHCCPLKSQKDLILFRNILVGDVWILGGQSNMYGLALPEERLKRITQSGRFFSINFI